MVGQKMKLLPFQVSQFPKAKLSVLVEQRISGILRARLKWNFAEHKLISCRFTQRISRKDSCSVTFKAFPLMFRIPLPSR